MKPPAEIAAQLWHRFRKPLAVIYGHSADQLVNKFIPLVREAIDKERAGWPTEKEWMSELTAELATYAPGEKPTQENLWRIALYRLQKRVLDGHA